MYEFAVYRLILLQVLLNFLNVCVRLIGKRDDFLIKSMTGYGRAVAERSGRKYTVELRAVNNRYLDVAVKLPRMYVFAEDAIKATVSQHLLRGKVDVFVSIEAIGSGGSAVQVNEAVAANYFQALCELRDTFSLRDDISVSLLSRFPEVLMVQKEEEDLKVISEDICAVLVEAISGFNAMRQTEGGRLYEDILRRTNTIETYLSQIEAHSPETVRAYREKLTARMEEILQNKQIDEQRILTEAAIFADKVAVDEETVRLRSHIAQLREIFAEGGAIGRKLDFLIQEFNREANTIGSKCNDRELTRTVVDLKGEIEKIREQVQNIE